MFFSNSKSIYVFNLLFCTVLCLLLPNNTFVKYTYFFTLDLILFTIFNVTFYRNIFNFHAVLYIFQMQNTQFAPFLLAVAVAWTCLGVGSSRLQEQRSVCRGNVRRLPNNGGRLPSALRRLSRSLQDVSDMSNICPICKKFK